MYEINIMENDEFDALPYKHAKSSLGMADAATGKAYVRRTGIEALDANSIRHEFDELLQSVSPHEEDGIRYKSGGGLGKWLGPLVGGAITVLSGGTLAPLGIGVGAGITGGTGAHSRSVKPEKYGRNTFGSVLTDAAIGGAGAYGAGSLGLGAVGGFQGAAPGFFSKLGGALKGAAGIGSGAAVGAPAGSVGAGVGGPPTALGVGSGVGAGAVGAGVGGGAAGVGAGPGTTLSALGSGALGAIKGAGKGLGKSLATNSLISSLAPPQSNAITGVGNAGGYGNAGNFPGGNSNVLGIFGNKGTPSTGEGFTPPYSQEDYSQGVERIGQQSSKQTGNVFDQFRSAQPGATVQGSSAFANQLAAVDQGYSQNIGSFTDQTNQANEDAYGQFRYDGVKNANGLDDAKMSEYINLAKQPDSVIKAQLPGMTPQAFKDIFYDLRPAVQSGILNADMDSFTRETIGNQTPGELPPYIPGSYKRTYPNIG